jgi:hypothetical protein
LGLLEGVGFRHLGVDCAHVTKLADHGPLPSLGLGDGMALAREGCAGPTTGRRFVGPHRIR